MKLSNFPTEPLFSRSGVTVAELKKYIADWPETNRDGEPTEVWVRDGDGYSHPCGVVYPLNVRTMDDGSKTSDLLFEP